MAHPRRTAGICGAAHLLVDGACGLLIFSGSGGWVAFLLYNFCAFALQLPLGLLCDRRNLSCRAAGAGALLLIPAALLHAWALPCALLAGLGNCLFHVGCGRQLLLHNKKCAPLGLFIAPGALGLFAGGLAASVFSKTGICLTAAAAALLARWLLGVSGLAAPQAVPHSLSLRRNEVVGGVYLMLAVMLRGYFSLSLAFSWNVGPFWPVAVVLAVVLGKAWGGLLADRIGVLSTGLFSLLSGSLLFCFSDAPLAGLAAIFCFQMTMPLTLWGMARLLPGAPGFAFGALSFCLFAGYLPVQLGFPPLVSGPIGYALLTLASLPLLLGGFRPLMIWEKTR